MVIKLREAMRKPCGKIRDFNSNKKQIEKKCADHFRLVFLKSIFEIKK